MQLISLLALAPLLAGVADASPARPASYNGLQANSIPIAISNPECAICGYDNTNSKTLITSVKVNTVAQCFTTCRQRQKCMSYGFCTQSNTCSLYKVALRKHIKRTSSSVIFYDRGCNNPAAPQSTRTTTSSATATSTVNVEDPITATAISTTTIATSRSTTSARSTSTASTTIASTTTASATTALTTIASTTAASTTTASGTTTTTTSASSTATPAPGAAFAESLNSAYNEVLFGTNANVYDPRSEIASLADCEDLCAADTTCVALNFYRADEGVNVAGNCNLLSNTLSGSAATGNVDSARKN